LLEDDSRRIGLRIYLLDNSASTGEEDGNIVDEETGATQTVTRWAEICKLARDHARWNIMLHISCIFMVLNPMVGPNGTSQSELCIDACESPDVQHLHNLDRFLEANRPYGSTPLTKRLADVKKVVKDKLEGLAPESRTVFVVVATDGIPTSVSGKPTQEEKDLFLHEVQSLAELGSVRIVFRMCTDDEKTIEFYNSIDADGKLPIDVLDDLASEAAEVRNQQNVCFAHTALIHRIREAGTLCSIFNSMDERQLNRMEVRMLARMLLEDGRRALNDTELVEEALRRQRTGLVFDAKHMLPRPVVDADELSVVLGVARNADQCVAIWRPFLRLVRPCACVD